MSDRLLSSLPLICCVALALLVACGPVGTNEEATGAPCELNIECVGGVCLPDSSNGVATGWAGGMCTRACLGGSCPEANAVCVGLGVGAFCLPACAEDGQCREGYVCHSDAGACLPDCRKGWDCGDGWACDEAGACREVPLSGADLGAPCAAGGDCESGVCLSADHGWTDGLCSAACPERSCPDGSDCVLLGEELLCVPRCGAEAAVCREGYVCNSALSVCLPDCRGGWDCGADLVCGETGECELSPPVLGALGAACAAPSDCASGVCFSAEQGWPDGLCADLCTERNCPEGASCVPLTGVPWCLPTCATAADCREGYACNDDMGTCVPDCRLGWDCGPAFECGEDGQCQVPEAPAGAIGLPCGQSQDCGAEAGMECLPMPPSRFNTPGGGVCTRSCAADPGVCPETTTCAPFNMSQYCFPACDMGRACPPHLHCVGTLGACLPHGAGRRG